jgi:hypothetical protein
VNEDRTLADAFDALELATVLLMGFAEAVVRVLKANHAAHGSLTDEEKALARQLQANVSANCRVLSRMLDDRVPVRGATEAIH